MQWRFKNTEGEQSYEYRFLVLYCFSACFFSLQQFYLRFLKENVRNILLDSAVCLKKNSLSMIRRQWQGI